jgi:hypothetical protein
MAATVKEIAAGVNESCYHDLRAMTATEFRKLALSFEDASESAHMSHPDFRVGGKIFATLGYPDSAHGMVVLPPEEQVRLIKSHPKVFAPAKGAWGKQGSTTVRLESIDATTLKAALQIAWRCRREPRGRSKKSG